MYVVPELKTHAEVLKYVGDKLLEQNRRSWNNDSCAYRGDEVRKCGVGFVISDEYYTPGLEGATINKVTVQEAVRASIGWFGGELFDILDDVQAIHDGGLFTIGDAN